MAKSPRKTPPEWEHVFEMAQVRNVTDLASKIDGIGITTVSDCVHGGPTSEWTVERVADVLRVSSRRVWEVRAEVIRARGELPPFMLPAEADELEDGQRDVVVALVAELVRLRRESVADAQRDDEELA